jgi:dihydroflavonol-4-reductase
MKLLITGASGFAGNGLLDLLPDAVDYTKLTLLVLPGDPGIKRLESRCLRAARIVEGDITDPDAVARAVEGHSHVIHLAGLISYWGRELARLTEINCRGVQNMVDACVRARVKRLVHVSSVGGVGFLKDGRLADEKTPYNWPKGFHYMTTKHAGQQIVEKAVRERGLKAVILNPASLMGPGDPDPATAHNQLYRSICEGTLVGCFAGGLAVADVRDLAAIVVKSLDAGAVGEKYLVVGSNASYVEVVREIGRCFRRRVYPFRIPSFLFTVAGAAMEMASAVTNKRPLLTAAYGRLSGWKGYYSNRKSIETFRHSYVPFEKTIADGCAYFASTHSRSRVR